MKKVMPFLILAGVLAALFVMGERASNSTVARLPNEARVAGAPEQTGALAIVPTSYDFGNISMKKGKVSQLFTLTNLRSEPVTVQKITTSCMCTEAFIVKDGTRRGPFGMQGHGFVPLVGEIVPPQGIVTVEVIYDPAAHGPAGVGRTERAVFIEDGNGDMQTLTIKALVTP